VSSESVNPQSWVGYPVTGAAAEPLGRVVSVFADPATGAATWAAVDIGTGAPALVPLDRAGADASAIRVPFDAEQLRTAPSHDPLSDLGDDQVAALSRHYYAEPAGPPPAVRQADASAADGQWVVRHEEQLGVVVDTAVVGRVRVRKYTVTEERTFTVSVTREEVSIEQEDVPAAEQVVMAAGEPGAELGDQALEIVRYEERVVVTKEVVPVERIRVVRHVVTEPQVVRGVVRREVVDVREDRTD
jgi:stress response protein YsnF